MSITVPRWYELWAMSQTRDLTPDEYREAQLLKTSDGTWLIDVIPIPWRLFLGHPDGVDLAKYADRLEQMVGR